ncbi:Peroxidase [Tolypocladium paradoxum]|uniref:Peroxidase n=1 Tax=Tolypocladium paradoxum TaxID=94208 RepID=A0A2S4KZI2_9HYPO|nr:Peroxidase [Tolypocladium paradoxum]
MGAVDIPHRRPRGPRRQGRHRHGQGHKEHPPRHGRRPGPLRARQVCVARDVGRLRQGRVLHLEYIADEMRDATVGAIASPRPARALLHRPQGRRRTRTQGPLAVALRHRGPDCRHVRGQDHQRVVQPDRAADPQDSTPGVRDTAFYRETAGGDAPERVTKLHSDVNLANDARRGRPLAGPSSGRLPGTRYSSLPPQSAYAREHIRLSLGLLGVYSINELTGCTKVLPSFVGSFDSPDGKQIQSALHGHGHVPRFLVHGAWYLAAVNLRCAASPSRIQSSIILQPVAPRKRPCHYNNRFLHAR